MKEYLQNQILGTLKILDVPNDIIPSFEKPRLSSHGDLTTNVAMIAAKKIRTNPRTLAQKIIEKLKLDEALIGKVEIAGPGFINFYFTNKFYQDKLVEILSEKDDYGKTNLGRHLKTQVEFVSANPTGPLTVGHGRGAVFGDTVARLLEWVGYDVTREYYFNNAGRQMRILGDSVRLRYLELSGEKIDFPEDYYQGEYIKEIARHIFEEHGNALMKEPAEGIFKQKAEKEIFDDIKKTLLRIGVEHDVFFNENSLYETGQVNNVIDELRRRNLAYEKDGALWFKATLFGIEKDKVIVKATGEPTYRLPDIAYHINKLNRGFEQIIDVLGADHIATYPDVLAGVKALGYDESKIKVLIHQFVTIMQEGEIVKMSTRKANFITLDELIDEVGADVVRYFFLMRGIGSHLNFDLKLAREQSEENPVYYLQYAHARIASIIRLAQSKVINVDNLSNLSLLTQPEEISLMKLLSEYPEIVKSCALTYEPHRLAEYLYNVAGCFHKFYREHRVISEDLKITSARIALCLATKTVLANGFSILGIRAPETM